jgi:ATP-binding cassette subfamily B protein
MMAWLWAQWRPWRWLLLPLVVLTVLNGIAVAAIPLALKSVFDTLEKSFSAANLDRSIEFLLAAGVARFFIYNTLQTTRAWMNARFDWSLRAQLFCRLLCLSPGQLSRFTLGDLVTRLTDDVSDDSKLGWFMCSGFFRTLEALTVIAVVVLAMVHICPALAWQVLVPVPVLGVAFVSLSGPLRRVFVVRQAAVSQVNAEIEATMSGVHLVKASGAEAARQEAFHRVADHRRSAEMAAVRWQILLESLQAYAWQGLAAAVLFLGGRLVILHRITLPEFVAFNGLALSLTMPMFDLGNFVNVGRQAMVFYDRLRAIESLLPDIVSGSQVVPVSDSVFRLQGASFEYDQPALSDVDLVVPRGRFVAIVGRVGTGKSTLLRLLIRLMDVDAGVIRCGDIPIAELSVAGLRASVGYVPQEAVLLSDTVRENIRFGRDGADVEEAARLAQLDMEALAEGLETRVGPRGVQLSGGQKQRVALARALAGRPPVLLLDDCTASLDAATEARLWQALREERPDLTLVVVTHRRQELERADDILVLGPGGKVLERGRHADLLAQGGEYYRLYRTFEEPAP